MLQSHLHHLIFILCLLLLATTTLAAPVAQQNDVHDLKTAQVLAPNPTQASTALTPRVLDTPIIQTVESPSPTPLATYPTPHNSLQTKTQNPTPNAENLVLRNRQYGGYGSYATTTLARSTTTPLAPKPAATSPSTASSSVGSTGGSGESGRGSTSSVDDRVSNKGLSTEAKIGIAVGVPTFLGFFVAVWMCCKSRD